MPKNKEDELNNYYVIKFEKYLDLISDIDKKYHILTNMLHDNILASSPEKWDSTPILCLIECVANIADIRKFLDNKINNAPQQEIKLSQKYNIKDVLISKDDLKIMNVLMLAMQELVSKLEVEHKIFIQVH